MKQSVDLYVLNRSEQVVAVLSDEGSACPYFNSEWLTQVNGVLVLKFDVPRDHPSAAYLEDDGVIILFRLDWEPLNTYHEYRVLEAEVNHDDNLLLTVYCEHARNELIGVIVTDKRPTNTTLALALGTALHDSRWLVGNTGDLGLNSTTLYYVNAIDAINTIMKVWGGEVQYRTVTDGIKITARYVDILPRIGADTGKRFEYEKDTDTIKRTIDRGGIRTAIYGRGMGVQTDSGESYTRRLTFADVEWSVTNGDPVDKPLGQEWVGNNTARDAYGYPDGNGGFVHIFGEIVDDQETDPEVLLRKTWEYLNTVNAPLVQYDFTILDIYSISGGALAWEKVDLGDTTVCIDDSIGAELDARVIEIKRDLGDLTVADVKIGNFLPHDQYSSTEQQVAGVQKTITDSSPQWSNPTTTDTSIPDIIPGAPQDVSAGGTFVSIMVFWEYVSTISLANYEVYGSEIPGFIPDSTNLLFRGKTNNFNHDVGTNKQWYYLVRAVNTHGNAGPFSIEVTASTARITTDDLMFGSVNADILADLSVDASKLVNGTISSGKLADMAVTASKLADGSITTSKIVMGSITEEKLADLSVSAAKLAEQAVTSSKIAPSSITNDHIDAGAITEAKMKWSTHLLF
jgi:phage minor structural protein